MKGFEFMAFYTLLTSTTTPTIDWGTISVEPITTAISSAIPVALPLVISIAGIRKAISFVVGMIRSA